MVVSHPTRGIGCEHSPMRLVVINLARAEARRQRVQKEFDSLGLAFEFHEAVDGRQLQPEHYALVDRETRRRLGLWPQANGSIANWFSQRQVMQQIVDNGPDMVGIFEDDVGLASGLPEVLAALECKPFDFDIVMLNRRSTRKPFIPCQPLTDHHRVGRVRYSDYGNEGYVITRDAARHFLENTPRMMWEIDQVLPRFWENGLNVYYVDPPVAFHNEENDSQIEQDRNRSRRHQRKTDGSLTILWRRTAAAIRRSRQRRQAFRLLLDGEIGVTHWRCNG